MSIGQLSEASTTRALSLGVDESREGEAAGAAKLGDLEKLCCPTLCCPTLCCPTLCCPTPTFIVGLCWCPAPWLPGLPKVILWPRRELEALPNSAILGL